MRDIIDIINSTHRTQEELQYVVEQYIKEKKGVDVDINLTKRLSHPVYLGFQLEKLHSAFNDAAVYFCNKNK